MPEADAVELWQQALADAECQSDYEQWVNAVLQLAHLGVDASKRLDDLVHRSIVQTSIRDLALALSTAWRDLDAALPLLRTLSRQDPSAAEQLVTRLSSAGRTDEAVAACDDAYHSLRQSRLLYLRAEVLLDAERWNDAESAARHAVSEPTATGWQRGRLLTFLGGRAADQANWVEAERHFAAAVRAFTTPRATDVWRLINSQLHQGHHDRAAGTVLRYTPEVVTVEHARLWFASMSTVPWEEDVASQALTLALRFSDDAQLSAALLVHIIQASRADDANDDEPSVQGSVEGLRQSRNGGWPGTAEVVPTDVDPRPVVPALLHRDALAALNAHVHQHGDVGGVQRLEGSVDELVDKVRDLFQARNHQGLREVLNMVRAGRAPLGVVASALGKSYALALIQRAAGVQVAAAADEGEHDLDLEAAGEALGLQVVVDASSLLLSSRLATAATLRGRFASLILPVPARKDILRASIEVLGQAASTRTLGWDDGEGKLVFYEMTARDRAILSERANSMERAAQSTISESVSDLTIFPDLDLLADGPWLGPVQVAMDRGVALWSDDVVVRQLARSIGVPSFGTPALTEALQSRAIDALEEGPETAQQLAALVSEQQSAVRAFVREFVVDVPAHRDDIVAQAAEDHWYARAGAVVLTRASWWAWQSQPYAELLGIYKGVAAHRSEALPAWQAAAMEGIGAAFHGRNELAAAMVGTIAILGFGADPPVDDVRAGYDRAQEVARRLKLPDPLTQAPVAVRILGELGLLPDPDGFLRRLLRSPEARE